MRAWLKPRRLLVKDLAEMTEEAREMRDALVRAAKDREALRADLYRERATVARLTKGLDHLGSNAEAWRNQ